MNCNTNISKNDNEYKNLPLGSVKKISGTENFITETEGERSSLLTTYKEVVDINLKNTLFYGLTAHDYKLTKLKIARQKTFLAFSHIYDKVSNKYISLKDIVISANHNPKRYHGEVQNRLNSIVQIAEGNNLKPLFITLTLDSEYHITKGVYKIINGKKTKVSTIANPKYNKVTPRESVKVLTKMFAKLRQDRSLKELTKDERIFYRVNEPHKDGTPHTHILLYVPEDRIQRVVQAFNRLYNKKGNQIVVDIKDGAGYIMKYINKTLPLSKEHKLTQKDKYLNTWYSKHRIIRFNSSKTLAPLSLYRLLYRQYSLIALTKRHREKHLKVYLSMDNLNKVMEIFDGDEQIYMRNENYEFCRLNCVDYLNVLKN